MLGAYNKIISDNLPVLDTLAGSDCLSLAMSVDEFDKFRRIFSTDSFYGKRVTKHEYPFRDKLRPLWKKFCDDVHVNHLLIQLDIIAVMINRRAVRSGMSLIDNTGPDEPQPQTQMWHRDKSPESDRNPSLQDEYGHCFSFVVSIGLGTQSLNYLTGDTEKEAFQLLLPPGTVVALGPEQLHAGSSCRGVRLHICYDVSGVDGFEVSDNHWLMEDGWPDWRSDSEFPRVDWKMHAMSLPIVTTLSVPS